MEIGCVVCTALRVCDYVATVVRWANLLRPFVKPFLEFIDRHVRPRAAGAMFWKHL
jgi:hypothetical protein